MAQWLTQLPYKCEDLSLDPQNARTGNWYRSVSLVWSDGRWKQGNPQKKLEGQLAWGSWQQTVRACLQQGGKLRLRTLGCAPSITHAPWWACWSHTGETHPPNTHTHADFLKMPSTISKQAVWWLVRNQIYGTGMEGRISDSSKPRWLLLE